MRKMQHALCVGNESKLQQEGPKSAKKIQKITTLKRGAEVKVKKNNISTINRSEIKVIVCTLEVLFYFKLIISTFRSFFIFRECSYN